MVKTKRQERLPGVFECLTHGALDATFVESNHLLLMQSLPVHLTVCCHVLLQTVKVESVAAFFEGSTRLILLVDDILHVQVIHHEFVPLNMRVFRENRASIGPRCFRLIIMRT